MLLDQRFMNPIRQLPEFASELPVANSANAREKVDALGKSPASGQPQIASSVGWVRSISTSSSVSGRL
jgi:hypothetical protein